MASKWAIATVLNGLAANYGKALDPALPGIWHLALADVSDEQLNAAAAKVVAREQFFPTIAKVLDALGLNVPAKPDTAGIMARIWSLADYHPQYGTNPPSVDRVRQALGETIGDTYALVTGERLFASSEVGRDIARREFTEDLTTAATRGFDVSLPALPPARQLAAGESEGMVIFDRPARRIAAPLADALRRLPGAP